MYSKYRVFVSNMEHKVDWFTFIVCVFGRIGPQYIQLYSVNLIAHSETSLPGTILSKANFFQQLLALVAPAEIAFSCLFSRRFSFGRLSLLGSPSSYYVNFFIVQ